MKKTTYKILGSDGDEYGPLSAEKIQEWIWEDRLEKKTPILPEGGTDWVFLDSLPEFSAIFTMPRPPAGTSRSAVGRMVPEKNKRASAAYYLGVVSMIPPFGALLGIPALVLGIAGLRFCRRHPAAGGRFHAWMGIILGTVFGFGYLTFLAVLIIGRIVPGHSIR
jgi:hypothetical protein